VNKGLAVLLLLCVCSVGADAQKRKRFSPEKFEAELEQFIATDACLSPQEASRFFPLYREMRKKQRAYFGRDRHFNSVNPHDDEECAEAIRRHDENEIKMKELQRDYHERFMTIMPASKVYTIIKSEDKFHRQIFKRATREVKTN